MGIHSIAHRVYKQTGRRVLVSTRLEACVLHTTAEQDDHSARLVRAGALWAAASVVQPTRDVGEEVPLELRSPCHQLDWELLALLVAHRQRPLSASSITGALFRLTRVRGTTRPRKPCRPYCTC